MADVPETPTTPAAPIDLSSAQQLSNILKDASASLEKLKKELGDIDLKSEGTIIDGAAEDRTIKNTLKGIDAIRAAIKTSTSLNVDDSKAREMLKAAKGGFDAFSNSEVVASLGASVSEADKKKVYNELHGLAAKAGKESGSVFGELFGVDLDKYLNHLPKILTNAITGAKKAIESTGLDWAKIVGSSSLVVSAQAYKAAVEKLPPTVHEFYAATVPVEKAIRQMAVSFGEVGKEGAVAGKAFQIGPGIKDIKEYSLSMAASGRLGRVSLDEVTDAAKRLAPSLRLAGATKEMEGFGAQAILDANNLSTLGASLKETGMKITPVTAAILLGKATMMDTSAVADILDTSMLELGAKGSEAATKSFVTMKDAADKSGLGMNRVSQSIISSTQALKMWGGTINSVTPLFNMFNESLTKGGIGRAGLTPELLGAFTSGIQGMDFAKRAFLGIQGGMGGGAGGALGAGLEMEAAMEDETGEGMKKIVGSLSDTLKSFGGGKIITREEARADPALLNSFLMQRQLVGQMTGMNEAMSNRMINALSGIQGTGLQVGTTQMSEVFDVLQAGKTTAEVQTPQEKATQAAEQAWVAAAPDITDGVKELDANTFKIGKALEAFNIMTAAGIMAGGIDKKAIMAAMKNLGKDTPDVIKKMFGLGENEPEALVAKGKKKQEAALEPKPAEPLKEKKDTILVEKVEKGKLTLTPTGEEGKPTRTPAAPTSLVARAQTALPTATGEEGKPTLAPAPIIREETPLSLKTREKLSSYFDTSVIDRFGAGIDLATRSVGGFGTSINEVAGIGMNNLGTSINIATETTNAMAEAFRVAILALDVKSKMGTDINKAVAIAPAKPEIQTGQKTTEANIKLNIVPSIVGIEGDTVIFKVKITQEQMKEAVRAVIQQ